MKPYVTEPDSISFRRWSTGKIIGYTKLVPHFLKLFGAPYHVIHRADFHAALYRRALDLGIEIVLGSKVVDYHAQVPSMTLADGSLLEADLIVAADGELPRFHHRIYSN